MKFEKFFDAVPLNQAERPAFFQKIAEDTGVSADEIESSYVLWEQEREASGLGARDSWMARANRLGESDREGAKKLLDDLAALDADTIFRRDAIDCICEKLKWSKTDCRKALNKEINAAKKRLDEALHKEKMAKRKARRVSDRKTFHNYHHVPFADLLSDVILHLAQSNQKNPTLFVSGTEIVVLHTNTKTGQKQIIVCDREGLRLELAKISDWSKLAPDTSEDAELDFKVKYTSCPADVACAVLREQAATLGLPELNGLCHAPFFDKEGNLVSTPGYHAASGYYYAPVQGFEVPTVSLVPSKEEVEKAFNLILFEMYGDFPFNDGEEYPKGWFETSDPNLKLSVGKASRANQVAKTLQPFVEQMIAGALPLHAVNKTAPRTGSQFLAEALGIVMSGSPAPVQTAPKTDEEWQKVIVTLANEGAPYCIFDNVKERIDSDALASAITADRVSGRELGRSRTINGRWRGITEVNGNALKFDRDIAERVLLVHLDTKLKDPGSRKVFRHPSLKTWCKETRGLLVWACLTIIQNWIAKGKPELTDPSRLLAGFEDYCRVVGGILEVAGIQGFNSNRALIRADARIEELDILVREWFSVFGTEPVQMGSLDADAKRNPLRRKCSDTRTLVELLLDMSDEITLGLFDNPNKTSLGSRLAKKLPSGGVFELDGGTYQLDDKIKDGRAFYRLVPINGSPERRRRVPGQNREDVAPGKPECNQI